MKIVLLSLLLCGCAATYDVAQPRMSLGQPVQPACLVLCSASVNIYDTEGDRVVGRGNVTSTPTITQSPVTTQSQTVRAEPAKATTPAEKAP